MVGKVKSKAPKNAAKVVARKKAKLPTGMLARFAGKANRQALLDEVMRQDMVERDTALANAIIDASELVRFKPGEDLIVQDATDSDVFFLISGNVSIIIKGDPKAVRGAGTTIGEMAAIENNQPRSATCRALGEVVALKMPAKGFLAIGKKVPQIWKPIARMLSRRLYQRNADMLAPNERPRLFVISSAESLPIADGIEIALKYAARVQVWHEGVFFAGSFALEALEAAVDKADFAVAIARGDDIVTSRKKQEPAMRDNVIFELGLFMGLLGRNRTFLLLPEKAKVKLPSDLQGLTCIRYRTPEDDEDMQMAVGAACAEIRQRITKLKTRSRHVRKA